MILSYILDIDIGVEGVFGFIGILEDGVRKKLE